MPEPVIALAGFLTALIIYSLVRLVGTRGGDSPEALLFVGAGTSAIVQSLSGGVSAVRDWDSRTAMALDVVGVVSSGATISMICHLSFHFPLRVRLPRALLPALYVPLVYSLAASPYVAPSANAPTHAIAATGVVFLGYSSFMVLNILRARRLSNGRLARARPVPIVVGIVTTLLVAGLSFLLLPMVGVPETAGAEAYILLPAYLGMTYAFVKYGMFDLELLRRRLAVATVCALLAILVVAVPVGLLVMVAGPAQDIYLPILALLAGAIGFGSWQLQSAGTRVVEAIAPSLKWKEGRPEEAFVIHRSGLVAAHRVAPGGSRAVDAEILGSMITAVQEFVRDSFAVADPGRLKTVNLGSVKMLLEHGRSASMVVIFSGYETEEMRIDVQRIIAGIEKRFGAALDGWDGRTASLEGIAEDLDRLWPREDAPEEIGGPAMEEAPRVRDPSVTQGLRLH